MESDERIIEKRRYRTNRTFVRYTSEDLEEYKSLQEKGLDYIIFTDRENVPDMKAIPGNQKCFQVQVSGKDCMTSDLPCSCQPCRSIDYQNCLYREDRNIVFNKVVNEEQRQEEDAYGFSTLTVAELK